ncbi:MAG: endonuclease domain-containing protein [Clostridia bacterium]|nr:endonuclease domain-containing protein [Clostridia bacterium]
MMKYAHTPALTPLSRKLRKEMTAEERHLWYDYLRHTSFHFRRQKVIGNYIVDFYCSQARLVIELDGSQHYTEENMAKDAVRTRYLESLDLLVLRYSNMDIRRNFDGVCADIEDKLRQRTASGSPARGAAAEGG